MKKLLSIFLLISLTASAQFRVSQEGANIAINNSITASGFGILNQSGTNMNVSVTNLLGMLNTVATTPLATELARTQSTNVTALTAVLGSVFQPLDSDLTSIAALTTTAFGRGLLDETDASSTRATLGLVIGTDVLAPNGSGASLTAIPATGLADGTTGTGAFVRSTNGVAYGTTITGGTNHNGRFTGTSEFETIGVNNFYPTNHNFNLTNVVLKTDGNGRPAAAVAGTDYVTPAAAMGYTVTLAGGWESGTLTDATTYFVGGDLYNSTRTGMTSYTNLCVKVPKAGTIKRVYVKARNGTAGTTETVSHYIRVNDATDVGPVDFTYDFVTKDGEATGLTQAVSAGDYIALKVVCPTWATNPIGTRWYCIVYIE